MRARPFQDEIPPGTLDMLVLTTLARGGERDGFEIAEATQQELREEGRDRWGFSELERVGKDLQYAVRQVIRRAAWTLVVVSTLALGIGANTSMFTLLDAMLFKPAPWNGADQLVWIASVQGRSGGPRSMSYPDYVASRDRATTVSGAPA